MLFNRYMFHVSDAFYAMLADQYQTVDQMTMIEFLLGDGL